MFSCHTRHISQIVDPVNSVYYQCLVTVTRCTTWPFHAIALGEPLRRVVLPLFGVFDGLIALVVDYTTAFTRWC